MNTYEITFGGYSSTQVAETPGKAKRQYFLAHEIGDLMSFGDFLRQVKCRLVSKFDVKDLFCENREQFEYVKQLRGIEFAYLGMRVEVDGKPGTIVGYEGANLSVCFDGQYHGSNCHPHWRIRYFDNKGNVIGEYGE